MSSERRSPHYTPKKARFYRVIFRKFTFYLRFGIRLDLPHGIAWKSLHKYIKKSAVLHPVLSDSPGCLQFLYISGIRLDQPHRLPVSPIMLLGLFFSIHILSLFLLKTVHGEPTPGPENGHGSPMNIVLIVLPFAPDAVPAPCFKTASHRSRPWPVHETVVAMSYPIRSVV